jgi:dihydroorotate dehydrogenase
MIRFSNGHSFQYMVASGALAFDGKGWWWERPLVWLGLIKPELFTVVIKSLTRYPREGNLRMWKPWECVRLLSNGGAVNKVGLTNPGIEWWCKKIGPRLDFEKFAFVGSMFGSEKELVEMTEMFNEFEFVAIEVNPSCPNSGVKPPTTEEIVSAVKAVHRISKHPIIVKVSVTQDYLAIAEALQGIAQAISLNSVPWETVFPGPNGPRTPLWKLEKRVKSGGGGVSGKPAQKYNWRAVRDLAKQGLIPVIGPSIMEFNDLSRLKRLGASAYSFGAIHLRTPWKPTSIVRRDMDPIPRSSF